MGPLQSPVAIEEAFAGVSSREQGAALAESLDQRDPVASQRKAFAIPEGIIYLDGNSLGALPHAAIDRVHDALVEQWGNGLIRSWTDAGWLDLPQVIGAKISRLIGADPDEVIAADSTSVNVYKLLHAACAVVPGRSRILVRQGDFPTDRYLAEGFAATGQPGQFQVIETDAGTDEEIIQAIRAAGPALAVVLLTHVDYRSGRLFSMPRISAAIREAGGVSLWDLAHSTGALQVDLHGTGADFAIGCGYKYLNGGPGAPAFLFVARRHHARAAQPLQGWMGHESPFEFTSTYRPAPGVRRHLCGTPAILSMTALEAGVDSVQAVPADWLRHKSLALTGLFIGATRRLCAPGACHLLTPRDPESRGSQVSLQHPAAGPLMAALHRRGVLGDFRPPDVLRFGFAPLYLTHRQAWDAACILGETLDRAIASA